MKAKSVYSFLTNNGFRTPDIKAYNPKQAYKIGLSKTYKSLMTKAYYKYDQDGIVACEMVKSL